MAKELNPAATTGGAGGRCKHAAEKHLTDAACGARNLLVVNPNTLELAWRSIMLLCGGVMRLRARAAQG